MFPTRVLQLTIICVLTMPATARAENVVQAAINAATTPAGVGTYVPSSEIDGDELRTFADDPIISGPLVCQLCDADFISEKSFTEHKKQCHAGECE